MLVPQGAAGQAAQAVTQAQQAVGVVANDHQPTLRGQHALDLAQDLVRIATEFQAVECHQRIDTVAGQW